MPPKRQGLKQNRAQIDRRAVLASAAASAGFVFAGGPAPAHAQTPAPTPTAPRLGVRPARGPGGRLDARSAPDLTKIVDTISAHVIAARYEDLDAATIAKAKHRFLDIVGCAIGGLHAEGNAALVDVTRATGGAPQATIIGAGGLKAPAGEAALVNAVISRSYDFEVMTVAVRGAETPSHHTPTTAMTALALSEQHRRSGKDFIAALAVGDDIAARMLAASGLDFGNGWDGVPLYAAFGATAIAARFSGLDAEQTRDAFGIAVDQIGGTIQSIWDGGLNWKLQQGTPARAGVFCAELAKRGWSGMADPLLAPYGFFSQFTSGCAAPELLTIDLGKDFFAEEYFKRHPSCAANHPAIQCAADLSRQHRLKPGDIASVTVYAGPSVLLNFVSKPFARTPSLHAQANFSTAFAVATALMYGDLRLEHYQPEAMARPDLARLIAATALVPLRANEKGVTIEVTLKGGRKIALNLPGQARGYPKAGGSTYEQIVGKFRQQAAFSRWPAARAEEIAARIAALESEPDMGAIAALLMG